MPAVTPALTPRLSLEATQTEPSSNSSASEQAAWIHVSHRRYLPFAHTNVAHIISQSLTENISGITPAVRAKFDWAKHFGGFDAREVLGEAVLHSPKNAFTSSTDPHISFDELDIHLTPVKDAQDQNIPNTYHVMHAEGPDVLKLLISRQIESPVVFKSYALGDLVIPTPDPRTIALHAACTRITHMSGASEFLRELYRDTEDISVMTEPDAAYELCRALKVLQTVSSVT
ncbi:hypothetical protein C8Q72DRAFT_886799 [Fomitopsis betulina]|nr:hypothetical protein C8Q72DRAFT_886799 [Fomitopsis betulina]